MAGKSDVGARFVAGLVWIGVATAAWSAQGQEAGTVPGLELHRGPIVAPVNVVGMGGAAIGIAEGSGAQAINPAAVATRYAYNGGEYWDWDWAVDWLMVGIGGQVDVENNGRTGQPGNTDLVSMAVNFVVGRLGFGFFAELQEHDLACEAAAACHYRRAIYNSVLAGLTVGYNFFDGELVIASGFGYPQGDLAIFEWGTRTLPDASTQACETQTGAFDIDGAGLLFGAVWRPRDWPLRVGATFRPAVESDLQPSEDLARTVGCEVTSSGLSIPGNVQTPWQLGVGAAFSLGPRELNPRPSFGDEDRPLRERYATPRWQEYWLFALDVILIGPTRDTMGVEAWLSREVQRAAGSVSLSVRAGAEAEFWPGMMRGRLGAYYEPSRFADVSGRPHATGGFDLYLLEWVWRWRFTFGFDVASRYHNTMFSLGFWH